MLYCKLDVCNLYIAPKGSLLLRMFVKVSPTFFFLTPSTYKTPVSFPFSPGNRPFLRNVSKCFFHVLPFLRNLKPIGKNLFFKRQIIQKLFLF